MNINLSKVIIIPIILLIPWASFLVKNFDGINQILFLILTILSTVIIIYNVSIMKNKIFFSFIFLIIYIFINNLLNYSSIIESVKLPMIILLALNSIVIMSYLRKNIIVQKKFILYGSYYILLVLLFFIIFDKLTGISYYDIHDSVTEGIAGNVSKYASILFPIFAIFIYYKQYLVALIQILLLLVTQRRSAVLAEAIFIITSFLPYIFNSYVFKNNLKKVISIFVIFIIIYTINYNQINELIFSFSNRLLDLTEGTAGGRKIFWMIALDYYLNFNTFELFFGKPGGLPLYINQYFGLTIGAHSDILDYLCNYGAVGLILYISIYISIFNYFWKYKNIAKYESSIGIALLLATFFLAISTGGFFYSLNLMYFIFTGYLIGVIELKKENNYE